MSCLYYIIFSKVATQSYCVTWLKPDIVINCIYPRHSTGKDKIHSTGSYLNAQLDLKKWQIVTGSFSVVRSINTEPTSNQQQYAY